MKTSPFGLVLAALLTATSCPATNVGLGTIEQPVNLGAESDPSRIPLGRVATESNYNYGRGPVITAPRPSLHGAMEWKGGTELNQNLANVFGIEASNHDLPYSAATIHLKSRPTPAYSPYSKEQVLAATIHCLLRASSGTPKNPIQLKITADSPDDQALVEKYSGEFINAKDKDSDPPVEPVRLPGCQLETDVRGITWVVFPDKKTAARPPARQPVMIPFRIAGGDFGPESPLWQLLPVWTGTGHNGEQSLEILGRPYPLFYDCFNPNTSMGPETNALFSENPGGSVFSFSVTESESSIDAHLLYPNATTETLSATVLAIVISTQPTAEQPLTVTFETGGESTAEWYQAFEAVPEWKTDKSQQGKGKGTRLSCKFSWDPETATLNTGAVPAVKVVRTENGELLIEMQASAPDN